MQVSFKILQFSSKGQRVVISEFGNDPIDALENHYRVEEFESPDPASLGPDDVLIKIKACAVSWVRKRQYVTLVRSKRV